EPPAPRSQRCKPVVHPCEPRRKQRVAMPDSPEIVQRFRLLFEKNIAFVEAHVLNGIVDLVDRNSFIAQDFSQQTVLMAVTAQALIEGEPQKQVTPYQ